LSATLSSRIWLDCDVHDVGDDVERSEASGDSFVALDAHGKERTLPSLVPQLRHMALTIEPGLYVRPAPGVPECYRNIGIRIEDDAVVTAQGCELISRGVPVDVNEIEVLMRG
jgi:Xaa-Pro aminopeptidase